MASRLDSSYSLPDGCKTVVHCVFKSNDPHGDVYACISDEVNKRSGTRFPVVPHMVHLPEVDGDLREELGIPATATVFGRHGGHDTFNLQFVHKTITLTWLTHYHAGRASRGLLQHTLDNFNRLFPLIS